MTATTHATCSLCDAICGIAVEHDGDRVIAIRGDVDDPFSKGHVCPKVIGLKHVHEDPDRVRRPLKRGPDGTFHEVAWDEALDEAAGRLARLQRLHGRDAVAVYAGTPTAHSYGAIFFYGLLRAALGTKNAYSATSMDSLPRLLAAQVVFGSPLLVPVPDLDRTALLVVIGANPVVSNGCMMTAPGVKKRILAIRARGGRVVVVDPRRSETAAVADAHHFIRPGSDAFFLASLVRAPASFVDGCDDVRAATAPFSPERTAALTGIGADVTRDLARNLAGAASASIHSRMGASTQEAGVVNSWLIDVLHALTGNLDRAGGAMFPTSPVPLAALLHRLGATGHFGRFASRVRGLPEFNGELPIAALAEEIETPGPGQIRGLITHAGNPALSAPNAPRVTAALSTLDTLVAIDIYVNETTRHAHFIFPPTFGLEHDHFPLLFHGLAVRNTAHYSPAVLPTAPDARDDWQILLELSARILGQRAVSAQSALAPVLSTTITALVRGLGRLLPPRRLLALLLRLGPHRGLSLAALDGEPHGRDLGALTPRLPAALCTATKRVDLAPASFTAALATLAACLDDAPAARAASAAGEQHQHQQQLQQQLLLIGRRDLRSNNSWMHNVEPLVRGEKRCTLLMHPDDAGARGLVDGEPARVVSRVGALTAEVQLSEAMMPGVVSLPHGWGHDDDNTQLTVARKHPGVSLNILTDDHQLDAVSGCAALNGVKVRVERLTLPGIPVKG